MHSPHPYFRYTLSLSVIIFLLLLQSGTSTAQSAISPAGGIISSSAGTISFTAGEPFLLNSSGNNGKLTGGIQQPYSLYTLGTDPDVRRETSLSLINCPDGEHFILISDEKSGHQLTYNLLNISGKIFQSGEITEKETTFSLSGCPPGLYLLAIVQGKNHLRTFRIVKYQ